MKKEALFETEISVPVFCPEVGEEWLVGPSPFEKHDVFLNQFAGEVQQKIKENSSNQNLFHIQTCISVDFLKTLIFKLSTHQEKTPSKFY